METLLREVSGKTYRVKCHHGCQHAGDGVLFKFNRGSQDNIVHVEEIGLDRHNPYTLDCTARRGTSDNWLLLKQENEKRPYTFALHRLPQNKFELYISGQDAAVDYMLEEVDPRYENREYYERRPSLKKARHGPARDPEEEAEMEEGARQGEFCAHSRSRSRDRDRSYSREDDSRDYSDSEDSYSYSSSSESSRDRRPAPKRKPATTAAPTKSSKAVTPASSTARGGTKVSAASSGTKKAPVATTTTRKTSAKGAATKTGGRK